MWIWVLSGQIIQKKQNKIQASLLKLWQAFNSVIMKTSVPQWCSFRSWKGLLPVVEVSISVAAWLNWRESSGDLSRDKTALLPPIEVPSLLFLVLYFNLCHYCHFLKVAKKNHIVSKYSFKNSFIHIQSHIIQFTHFKCTIQWLIVYSEFCIHHHNWF